MRQTPLRQFGIAFATAVAVAGSASAQSGCTFDIPFRVASASLDATSTAFLSEFAAKNPSITVSVTGYASPEGASAANLALSQARADTVATFLTTQSGRITLSSVGRGESAEAGRIARVMTERCKLPAGFPIAGSGSGAGLAVGAITPTVAAVGGVVGALALGAALSSSGDSSSSGTSGTTSTPGTNGTNGTTGTTGTGG